MSPQDWNKEVEKYAPPFGAFLQMWEWGEVQMSLGAPIKRIYEKTPEGVVLAQGIWQPLPLKASYWLFPKAPLGNAPLKTRLEVLKKACEGSAFVKIEPDQVSEESIFATERHPAHTMIVNLPKDIEEMYARMKPKTRYNIRLAQKKGVQVEYAGVEGLSRFMALMRQTAERDGFHAHAPDRYRAIVERFQGPTCSAFFAFATYDGKDLAANIMIDAEKNRTYLHGASANTDREVMAPYALHATLMEEAIKKGMEQYDFWGVAPEGADATHAWAGITRFKAGFGGERVHMPGTFDIPIRPLAYKMYRLARKVRGRS
jgi:lipid II:glycine glycyltransferase (peptidoglycan interpeptide bridge formation enzyme)